MCHLCEYIIIVLNFERFYMALITKNCAACTGDLYFYTDIDGFNCLKCMQCSREYPKENIDEGNINAA
jgi:hypothetical protein|tara:strand:- start:461 stop:664 length:204 start_codon:yes stop_codon:yes gene_type:complete